MTVKEKIKNLLKKIILKEQKKGLFLGFNVKKIKVESPKEKIFGDYSTNVALQISKISKKNPIEIAQFLKEKIEKENRNFFEKIEIKKPGFINFFLSLKFLHCQLKKILKKRENFGKLKIGKNKKTNIEFISANPTGQLHIGNARAAFFGDCLAKVLEMAGFNVKREYFINDAKINTQIQELGKTALGKGKAYLTPYLAKLILKLKNNLKKIKSESEAGYFLAKNILRDIQKFIEEKLKIKFDYWISEQNLYAEQRVKKIFDFLKSKKFTYEKEGTVWLDLSKFGLKDEVLIRKNGFPTYFLSDIAYHQYKIERGFKKLINIWGADHQGHVPRMKAVMKILAFKGEFDILISQLVTLKGKKISKRKGEIVTLEDLIKEIGLEAARFLYLTKSLDCPMELDLDLAKEQSKKNPLYYFQYAHARICSIFKRAKIKNFPIRTQYLKLLTHPKEINLIKHLIKFPDIILDTAKDYQVQRIPQYALELATFFHQFYDSCQVISQNKKLTFARLYLILAIQDVFKILSNLLGISLPQKM